MLAHIRMRSRLVALIAALVSLCPSQAIAGSIHGEKPSPDFTAVWMERKGVDTLATGEPPMRAAAAATYKASKPGYGPYATIDSQDPTLSCCPPGVPRIMLMPFPMQIVQTRDEVIIIFEYDHFVRQVYMTRKEHPKDIDPTWMGDSIGKWDGDTLVVDTTGLNDKTWLDQAGHQHSDSSHVVERTRPRA